MARSSTTFTKKNNPKALLVSTMVEKRGSIESTYPYTVYKLGGISYVPHYLKSIYVGPGYPSHDKTYTEDELVALGAAPKTEMLWLRSRAKESDSAEV